jgi:hypothetical protein
MLDEQIDLKVKMKTILSVDQFEKWDAMKGKHPDRRTQRMQKKWVTEWIVKRRTEIKLVLIDILA